MHAGRDLLRGGVPLPCLQVRGQLPVLGHLLRREHVPARRREGLPVVGQLRPCLRRLERLREARSLRHRERRAHALSTRLRYCERLGLPAEQLLGDALAGSTREVVLRRTRRGLPVVGQERVLLALLQLGSELLVVGARERGALVALRVDLAHLLHKEVVDRGRELLRQLLPRRLGQVAAIIVDNALSLLLLLQEARRVVHASPREVRLGEEVGGEVGNVQARGLRSVVAVPQSLAVGQAPDVGLVSGLDAELLSEVLLLISRRVRLLAEILEHLASSCFVDRRVNLLVKLAHPRDLRKVRNHFLRRRLWWLLLRVDRSGLSHLVLNQH
mmetsp:Transcript_9491/g.21775  ORF Transcript_9491/g.21775 Transcript_9491/m.21775 type:complete len:329 (-) Transcript_9491:99-1085(-)